jgi:type II secretory pathway pseudopilin PulG
MNLLKRTSRTSQSGVTLLEVLIFMTLLSLIIIAIVYSTTLSLKRTQFNQRKIFATRYAEEVEEWMRGEKEVDWTVFSGRAPNTYCMNTDIGTCDSAGTCWDDVGACAATDYSLDAPAGLTNGYKRSVVLSPSGSRVDMAVTVEWVDGPNTFDVGVNSTFSRWE